jgi:hypothetical protein
MAFFSDYSPKLGEQTHNNSNLKLADAYISLEVFHFIDPKVTTDRLLDYRDFSPRFVFAYRDRSQYSIDSFRGDFHKSLDTRVKWQCGIRVRHTASMMVLSGHQEQLNQELGCIDHRNSLYLKILKKEGVKYRAGSIQVSFLYSDEQDQRWCKVINVVAELCQSPAQMLSSIDPYSYLLGRNISSRHLSIVYFWLRLFSKVKSSGWDVQVFKRCNISHPS